MLISSFNSIKVNDNAQSTAAIQMQMYNLMSCLMADFLNVSQLNPERTAMNIEVALLCALKTDMNYRAIPVTITRLSREDLIAIRRPPYIDAYILIFSEQITPRSPSESNSETRSPPPPYQTPSSASESLSEIGSPLRASSQYCYTPQADHSISYSPVSSNHCSTCCSCESRVDRVSRQLFNETSDE
ncbi:hypothetical protein QAD02_010826 [Eretmocerus hayati]|uniref:Uncharacterized protein n=1 Tax=Eretmocerus hayati TaxID=131215 RepID=A0ACC2NUV0_9HYME|nr:hypothetical protein QAD02_010826 [Eretmocerus hayati]